MALKYCKDCRLCIPNTGYSETDQNRFRYALCGHPRAVKSETDVDYLVTGTISANTAHYCTTMRELGRKYGCCGINARFFQAIGSVPKPSRKARVLAFLKRLLTKPTYP